MTSTTLLPIVFVVWDRRPAALVGGKAFAELKPGAAWVQVDEFDVGHTGAVLPEAVWREYFYVRPHHQIAWLRDLSLDCPESAYGQRCEWMAGYPKATEAEIQTLIDAEKKGRLSTA